MGIPYDNHHSKPEFSVQSAGPMNSTRHQRIEELYWRAPTKELLARAPDPRDPGLAVLDAGFGSGHSTVWLELATDAACVECLDCSINGAQGVRKTFRAHFPKAKVRVARGSVEVLPYREERFDVIFCRMVLQEVNREAAIAEMRRTLKPGGRLFIVAELGGNPVAKWFRRLSTGESPAGEEPQRLNYSTVQGWYKSGFCGYHAEHHLLTPLLFPVLLRAPHRIGRMLLSVFRIAEAVAISRFPSLRKYCRFCFVEIVK